MFKKPLKDIKTLAPIRASDRRKLEQKIVDKYALDAALLVPDRLLSIKFTTHQGQPGVAYFSPDGDPVWFTIGKGSDDLIPTVYTLWKRPTLLPVLSTPSAVIPVLIGGADLMIPGVLQHPPALRQNDLVSITEHGRAGPPLAVGSMAVDGNAISRAGAKGKAVLVLHTWKDALFDQGRKGEPPEVEVTEEDPVQEKQETPAEDVPSLTPQEVSTILHTSLLQAIKLVPSSFPISATTFYTSYILPSRPAHPPTAHTLVDIKHSTHKSLTAFLKLCEKEGLIKLKDMKSELVITAVFPNHADVVSHQSYTTLKDVETKREEREEAEKNKIKELAIVEKWKPHQQTIKFFQQAGRNISTPYPLYEIKAIVNEYVATQKLANPNDPQFVDLDECLRSTVTSANENVQRLRREEIAKRLVDKMQNWYEIQPEGKDVILKKGQLKPISVVVKIRQGRKAVTLITDFEPYLLTAEFLAEELRRICASATSVSPIAGKSHGMEVLVQGKQTQAVAELLTAQGIPKKWMVT